ncbi:probable ATP-dependent RNA helicase ddx56 [Manihot esculenta]|uniref:Uncharacterized protein n=1 Tax=Manihot esculenta TaxID=3983 RepID=A0A251J4Y7_MANES|nr:probable ATP-dependent RNA helicase ddx56 [Manihot esculenta]XP_021600261.1 probable ATP-dependent RNA helicase ddx56 [Manihot esculenta]OAY23104.1 hypothetical protein MANES_18G052200v8 [Manihot esculenta]OAY23105.1 hypothetical protein MANES_18G052200v8 [Manihot esculenta]
MLKHSPGRNQRSKGFKVKHFLQICLLLTICIWLLNQLRNSYDKQKAFENSTGDILDKVQSEHPVIKLGRKDLLPQVEETSLEIESDGDKAELEEEIEELKPDDIDDDGRGGGDDEIDGHDQERAEDEETEEVEDLIDVDDRERDVGNEEQDSEEKGNQLEDASSVNHQAQHEGERNSQEAREEHYKGDDASSSVVHNTRTRSTEFQIGGMRKIKWKIGPSVCGTVSNANSNLSSVTGNLGGINTGVATVSKSMVTEIMKLDAAASAISDGNNAFTTINKNNNAAASNQCSESNANETRDCRKKLSISEDIGCISEK